MSGGQRPRSVVDGLRPGITSAGDFPAVIPANSLLQRNSAGTEWNAVAPASIGATDWTDLGDTAASLTEGDFSRVSSGSLAMFDLFGTANTFTEEQEVQAGVNINDGIVTASIANAGLLVGTGAGGGGTVTHSNQMTAVFGDAYAGSTGAATVLGRSTYGGLLMGRAYATAAGAALADHTNYGWASICSFSAWTAGSGDASCIQAGGGNISSCYVGAQNAPQYGYFGGYGNIGAVYMTNVGTNADTYVYQNSKGSVLAIASKPVGATGDAVITQNGAGLLTAVYSRSRAQLNTVTHSSQGGLMAVYLKEGGVVASGDAATAIGKAGLNNNPGYLYAAGAAAFAQGFPSTTNTVSASGDCSWAIGRTNTTALSGNIYATATNAIQFFPGSNGDQNSIGIGESFQFFGADTDSAKSTAGHLWRTATGSHVRAFTGGYDRSLSLVPGETASSAGTTATVGVDTDLHLAGTGSGNTTVSLPASPIDGRQISVKKTTGDGNTLYLSGNGNNIDGAATQTIGTAQWDNMRVEFDGSNWYII